MSPPRPLRGVIFDKDGTLFDFLATWGAWTRSVIEAEAREDAALQTRLAGVLGYDLATGSFLPDSIVIAETVATLARTMAPLLPDPSVEALVGRLNAAAATAPQVPAAPLAKVLGQLRAGGLSLGLATNDSEASARAHLATAGVLDRFDFVAGYDSGHGGKPAPGQLLAFSAAIGVPPGSIAMVGDSLHDLAAARAAGMVPVGVLTGPATREVLEPHAAVVLPSVAALPEWLGLAS